MVSDKVKDFVRVWKRGDKVRDFDTLRAVFFIVSSPRHLVDGMQCHPLVQFLIPLNLFSSLCDHARHRVLPSLWFRLCKRDWKAPLPPRVCPLIALYIQNVISPEPATIFFTISFCVPMASMVTTLPSKSVKSSSFLMALISLDFWEI